jgi:hypothetical protein
MPTNGSRARKSELGRGEAAKAAHNAEVITFQLDLCLRLDPALPV